MDYVLHFYRCLVLSWLVLVLPCATRTLDDCPSISGKEEYNQMKKFWMKIAEVDDDNTPSTVLARKLALDHLYNVRVKDYSRTPYKVTVKDPVIKEARRGYMVRIVMTEVDGNGKDTDGGSSFRGELKSINTRMPCATRDYFNGTYLMCCSMMESNSSLSIVHEYQQFTAYEVYDKRLYTDIFNKKLTLRDNDVEIIRPDQRSCYDVHMGMANGYWVWNKSMREWEWVVDGCKLRPLTPERANKCIEETYHNKVTAMGDSHMRNLFYYIITYIDPSYINQQKVHRSMAWHQHYYIWSTSCLTIVADLRRFCDSIEDEYNKHGTTRGNRHLLFVDMGVWQMISRPAYDYVLCVEMALPTLQKMQQLGIVVIWQNMPSNPKPKFEEPLLMINIGAKRSNHVVGALNYVVCHLLSMVDVECIPNWLFSYSWRDELVCGGNTHTMCAHEGGRLEVTAPGKASSQYGLLMACPLSEEEFDEQFDEEIMGDMDDDPDHPKKLFNVNTRVNYDVEV